MDEKVMFNKKAIVDIEEELKEEEFFNTIKMEPILESTLIEEEDSLLIKKKKIKATDIFLGSMIFVLGIVFLLVVFRVV